MAEGTGRTRRAFIRAMAASTAGAGLAWSAPGSAYAQILRSTSPSEQLVVGVIGTGGRGSSLAHSFAHLPGAEVAYVCDVDERRTAEAREAVYEVQGKAPEVVADLRRVFDDGSVDAVVIATPDHWHAPAAILAMQAGKHVYVEKPGSHNPREGELLVEAARKYDRVVQMGNQRRSWPKVIEAIERVKEGAIGPVHYARGWYANARESIGNGRAAEVPEWLRYELWQGPAPRTAYRDNILHYNWHWFWRWGTGEAGNNGVHALDLCRWGLGVDYPTKVTAVGGRYFWNDDQETPDTLVLSFEFEGEKSVMWEGLSCNRRGIDGSTFGASFHGEDGSIVIEGLGYSLFDKDGGRAEEVPGEDAAQEIDVTGPGYDIDVDHLANFREAIRGGERLHSPIDEGQKSTLLCHLGNIAYRTGHALHCDPKSGRIVDDPEAMQLWGREYASGWEPQV